jgi:hypothetical protein
MRIEAKVAGSRRRLFEPTELDWPDSRSLTLRELLGLVVAEEVASFRERQAANQLLRVLTEAELAEGVLRGKVASGGSDLDQEVDEAAAVETALEAFADGFYFVFVDDEQITELEAEVTIGPASTLLFVRLVPLSGH